MDNLYLGIPERDESSQVIGHCIYCLDDVVADETHYETGSGMVHFECLEDYIIDEYSAEEIAEALDFKKVRGNSE